MKQDEIVDNSEKLTNIMNEFIQLGNDEKNQKYALEH